MKNRRCAVRVEVDRAAQVATRDGGTVRGCNLRNLSSRGACLALPDHADLPSDLVLLMPADTVSWPCRIVRRQTGEIGVVFV